MITKNYYYKVNFLKNKYIMSHEIRIEQAKEYFNSF